MKFQKIILMAVCLPLVGCAWFHPKVKPIVPIKDTQFVATGRVVAPTLLEKGGRVAMIPFTAGSDVEATQELDRISLMMVRGLADTLNNEPSKKIIFSPEEDETDFIITGHITQLSQPSKFKEWIFRNHKIILSIDGKMVDAHTKQTVLVFSDLKSAQYKKVKYEALGQIIGQDIAKFILSVSTHP